MNAAKTWDEMSPRERDALVAEKVMEIPRHRIFGTNYELGSGADFNVVNYAPKYTTSIAAAWEVVEKMHEEGWSFCLEMLDGLKGGVVTFWQGIHFQEPDALGECLMFSPTPEAICLAALRAKGVEV